jgi:predicted RNA-binding protein with PUA-like domain
MGNDRGKEMFSLSSTKTNIEAIQKGDKVFLYSSGTGIIATGIADGVVKKKADMEVVDAEYYMSLTDFYQLIKEIPHHKILSIIQKVKPDFKKPFTSTSLKFTYPESEGIWNEVSKYV